MKKNLPLLAVLALTGCKGPMGFDRPWHEGATVHIGEFTVQASMSGAGSVVMRDVSWIGTNGIPLSALGTNAIGSITVSPVETTLPSGTMLRVK